MSKKEDIYHSILIVSASEKFTQVVKETLKGFVTVDTAKSSATARRLVLERYYDIVAINAPLPDEDGIDLALYITEKSSASVLLVPPQEIFEDVLDRVTDGGVLCVPKPATRGRIDKAIRLLAANQGRIRDLEKKIAKAEEKVEELKVVSRAKIMLIEKRHMTEDEAHAYIGKEAMGGGISRRKAAERIMDDL